jgi:colanic acid biosynthesis glycosyl transferase WcaI
MRIVVWGINYAPEFTGIAPHNVALCEFLCRSGDIVEMITGFAYYPAWEKRPEDQWQVYRTDEMQGVKVHRSWEFVPKRVSSPKRILHEATFVLTSTLRALFLGRPDVYVVVSPPLFLGLAAWFVSVIKNVPFVFHVQDMQPDAAFGLGMLKSNRFIRLLYGLESFAYRKAARVSGITRGMLSSFSAKGVEESKLIYLPNTIVLNGGIASERGEFRRRYGFSPDEFLAIYAGNLGVKQGLEILVEAAALLPEPRIRIVICGAGAQRDALEKRVRAANLSNVIMLPLQMDRDYQALLVDADVCLITQQVAAGSLFFPSKILGILAQSKPVVTVASPDSELALSVAEGNFGVNVVPGQPRELADLLVRLARDPERLMAYGRAGRHYVEQFEQRKILSRFARELESLESHSR